MSDMTYQKTKTDSRGSLRATFSRDGKAEYVEISILGDPSVFRGKVQPEHIQRFPKEWDAYQAGREDVEVDGTPLTDVPGINRDIARQYMAKGVRTAEELAEMNDMACSRMGLGAQTARKAAQHLLAAKRLEAMEKAIAAQQTEKRKPGRPRKAKEATPQ